MNIWDNYFTDLLILVTITGVIWAIIKYREVADENEKLKQQNNKEILASVHDLTTNESLAKLISDPDDLGLSGESVEGHQSTSRSEGPMTSQSIPR